MGAESQRSGSGSLRPVKTGPYKKRSSYPVSHKTVCRPLLPSGPGGIEQRLVAQDLTSQTTHQKPNRLQKCDTNETVARSGRADIWGGNARLYARIPPRGADRDRTDDLPACGGTLSTKLHCTVVELIGIEPTTFPPAAGRSPLNYIARSWS